MNHDTDNRRASRFHVEALEGRALLSATTLAIAAPRDAAFDDARHLLYVTTGAGTVERYDLSAHALLNPWQVSTAGASLRGADLAPDGSALYVADGQGFVPAARTSFIRKVELAGGTVSDLGYASAAGEGAPWDVAAAANGQVFVTAASAAAPVQIDPVTGAAARRTGFAVAGRNIIARSGDHARLAFGSAGTSATLTSYSAATDSFGPTFSGEAGFPAVSGDGQLLATRLATNDNLSIVGAADFHAVHNLLASAATVVVAFDPGHSRLLVGSGTTVVAYDTRTWLELFRVDAGVSMPAASPEGDWPITVSDDGRTLALVDPAQNRVTLVDLPVPDGVPARIDVSGFPSFVSEDVPAPFTVTVRDAAGEICTGYRGTVQFLSDDYQALLPEAYTFTADDAGAHAFTAAFRQVAPWQPSPKGWTLTAQDVAGGLSGSQRPILVGRIGEPEIQQAPVGPVAVSDQAYDAGRGLLYLSTTLAGGTIQRYDPVGDRMLAPIDVGMGVNALDLSPDGRYLYAAGAARSLKQATLFRVDLASGDVLPITYDIGPHDGPAWDVAAAAGGKVFVTGAGYATWSDPAPLRQYDVATGAVTARPDYGLINTYALLERSADGGTVYVAEARSGGVRHGLYDAAADQFVAQKQESMSISNSLRASVSRDGSLVALWGRVYDRNFNLVQQVGINRDVDFDPGGDLLFGLNNSTGQLVAYDTHTWQKARETSFYFSPNSTLFRGPLTVGGDGRWVFASLGDTPYSVRSVPRVSSLFAGAHVFPLAVPAGTDVVIDTSVQQPPDATTVFNANYRGTVRLTSSDPAAVLPGDYTFTAADAGQKSFTVRLNTPGRQTVTVTDVATGLSAVAYDLVVRGTGLSADGTLHVLTSDAADTLRLAPSADGTELRVELNGGVASFPRQGVRRVEIFTYGGADRVTVEAGVPGGLIDLGGGADTVTATSGDDPNPLTILGGDNGAESAADAATLYADGGGQPILFDGGFGTDPVTVYAGAGDDTISLEGNTRLRLAPIPILGVAIRVNRSTVSVAAETLTVEAGDGDDEFATRRLFGTANLRGGAGNDRLTSYSGSGATTFFGGAGDDEATLAPVDADWDRNMLEFRGEAGTDTLRASGNGGYLAVRPTWAGNDLGLPVGRVDFNPQTPDVERVIAYGSAGTDHVSISLGTTAAGLPAFTVEASDGNDLIESFGAPAGAVPQVNGGAGDDTFTLSVAATSPAGVARFDGGDGNDTVSVAPSSPTAATAWSFSVAADRVDDGRRQVLDSNVESISLAGGAGGDVFRVIPRPGAKVTVTGGSPAAATPPATPGDRLLVDPAGASGMALEQTGPGAGRYTFADRQPVVFTGVEALSNLPPVVGTIAPITVGENRSIKLSQTGSSDPDSPFTYEWDFDYDGARFDVNAAGPTPTFNASAIDGPATRTVALRLRDDTGAFSGVATTVATILNTGPQGSLLSQNGRAVPQGTAVTFAFFVGDAPADQAAGFRYAYDFDNDGVFEVVDSASDRVTAPGGYFSSPGDHTVHGRVTDKDGGSTDINGLVQVLPTQSQGVTPTADALVADGPSADANFGAGTTLDVRTSATPGETSEAYLRFSLSGLAADFTSAMLSLAGPLPPGIAQAVTVDLYAVAGDADWAESGLTWNNRPATEGGPLASVTIPANTPWNYYGWDVTSYLRQRQAAGAASVTFVLRAAGTSAAPVKFASKDYTSFAFPPYLSLTRPADTAAPAVTRVSVDGTGWSPAFCAALESAGIGHHDLGYGASVLGGAAPPARPLPWLNLDRLSVRFSEPVDVPADALHLQGVAGADYALAPGGFSYDPVTFTATWTLAQPLARPDRLRLSLAGVADPAGNPLADFALPFDVVPGDVDRNGRVDALDLLAVRARMLRRAAGGAGGAQGYSPFADVNGDGWVLADDYAAVRMCLASALPPASLVRARAAAVAATFAARRIADEVLGPSPVA